MRPHRSSSLFVFFFAFGVCPYGFHDEILFGLGELAEIIVEVLQRLIVGINVVALAVRLAEQIVCRRVENVRDRNDLLEGGAGTSDLPAAHGGLLYAQFVRQFALRRVVLFS